MPIWSIQPTVYLGHFLAPTTVDSRHCQAMIHDVGAFQLSILPTSIVELNTYVPTGVQPVFVKEEFIVAWWLFSMWCWCQSLFASIVRLIMPMYNAYGSLCAIGCDGTNKVVCFSLWSIWSSYVRQMPKCWCITIASNCSLLGHSCQCMTSLTALLVIVSSSRLKVVQIR